jgi:hypothetical protein
MQGKMHESNQKWNGTAERNINNKQGQPVDVQGRFRAGMSLGGWMWRGPDVAFSARRHIFLGGNNRTRSNKSNRV